MLKGCDISKWQGIVDFDKLKTSIDFVVIRSSYGNGYVDGQFARNRDEARRVGLVRGFYHYAYPTYNTPEVEADWFCKVVGKPQKGEFLVLDFEETFDSPVSWCKKFLDKVSANLGGYKPLIYLNKAFLKKGDWQPVIQGNYGLWLAYWDYNPDSTDYGADVPWGNIAMRQWSNKEPFPGVSGGVDANVFYGTKEQLLKYGYQDQSPAPVPTPPAVEKLPKDSVIADIYEFLTGQRASQDEVNWRLSSNKNLVEIGNDICTGDSRFKERWVTPNIPVPDPTVPPVPPSHCPVPEPQPVSDEECLARVKKLAAKKQGFWNKLSFVLSLLS